MTLGVRVLDNRAMRTMNPLPRVLLAWLMLAALLLGALNWARSASPANFFLAGQLATAHAPNSLVRLGNWGFDYRGESDAPVAAKGGIGATEAVNFSRELTAADLGVKGTIQELRGTFAVNDGVATMRVDMIRGEIQNPLQVVGNMVEAAKANGATTLRIEGTIANERLYNVLQNRYGLTSSGATDLITIPLR